jgi:hypothetical protein
MPLIMCVHSVQNVTALLGFLLTGLEQQSREAIAIWGLSRSCIHRILMRHNLVDCSDYTS